MKFDRIGKHDAQDELPSLPLHAEVVFLPSKPPRWIPAMMLAGLVFYPLLGWAIYALFW